MREIFYLSYIKKNNVQCKLKAITYLKCCKKHFEPRKYNRTNIIKAHAYNIMTEFMTFSKNWT